MVAFSHVENSDISFTSLTDISSDNIFLIFFHLEMLRYVFVTCFFYFTYRHIMTDNIFYIYFLCFTYRYSYVITYIIFLTFISYIFHLQLQICYHE